MAKDSLAFYRELTVLGRMACAECCVHFSLKRTSDFSWGGGAEEEESCRHPTLFITEDVAVDGTTPNPEHLHFQPQLPSRSDRMRRKLEGEGQRWPSWGDTVLTKMCTPPSLSIGYLHRPSWYEPRKWTPLDTHRMLPYTCILNLLFYSMFWFLCVVSNRLSLCSPS